MLAETVMREQLELVSALRRGEKPDYWRLEAATQSLEAALASLEEDAQRSVLTDLFNKALGQRSPEAMPALSGATR